MQPFMTYFMSDADENDRLKRATRSCCNFWNRFLIPKEYIVMRVGTFYSAGLTIARAYYPFSLGVIKFGRVEFNKKYLAEFTEKEITGTLIHEAGHTLGMGWDKWLKMFSKKTGKFYKKYVELFTDLEEMRVELDYGPGTELSHWDEDVELSGRDLMSGLKNKESEYVLPITIDVYDLLGHTIIERLPNKASLDKLIDDVSAFQFEQKEMAVALNVSHFDGTPVMEEVF